MIIFCPGFLSFNSYNTGIRLSPWQIHGDLLPWYLAHSVAYAHNTLPISSSPQHHPSIFDHSQPFLTRFISLKNIILFSSISFPNRSPHRQSEIIFVTLTACYTTTLCTRCLSYICIPISFFAPIPQKHFSFRHRHTNLFTSPLFSARLMPHTCIIGALLYNISRNFPLFHTLDISTSQHFLFYTLALLVCPLFHTFIQFTQL